MSNDPAQTGPQSGGHPGDSLQEWRLDGPRVLDVGGVGERVSALRVGVVGGRVDVVTHDDSPTARVEVTSVTGLPVHVRWDGHTLSVTHGKDSDKNLLEMIRRTVESFSRNAVVVSISVPVTTDTSVSTVGAAALISGLRGRVRANTVSGVMTLSDLQGELDLNTVSGDVECTQVVGTLKINSVSGGVTVQGGDLPRVKVNTVSGDIALDLTGARCHLSSNSVSGDITVRAPLRGYDVEATTASGQVVVDGTTVSGAGGTGGPGGTGGTGGTDHGKGKGGHVREGDGALTIKAHAVSGNLVVLRATPSDRSDSPSPGPSGPGSPSGPAPQDAPGAPPAGSHPQDHPDGWSPPGAIPGWRGTPEPGAPA